MVNLSLLVCDGKGKKPRGDCQGCPLCMPEGPKTDKARNFGRLVLRYLQTAREHTN